MKMRTALQLTVEKRRAEALSAITCKFDNCPSNRDLISGFCSAHRKILIKDSKRRKTIARLNAELTELENGLRPLSSSWS